MLSRTLVSTVAEQQLPETLLDRVKLASVASRQHFLLTTPFRYPPLRHGSRFGTRRERGIWYGSETRETAFSEVAYYRMVFLEATRADIDSITTELSAFRASANSRRGVDLASGPFKKHRAAIASPTSYAETQALGAAMRASGVELLRYPSARDPGGINVAAFTPTVFGKAKPRSFETWSCTASREAVEFVRRLERDAFVVPRDRLL